MDPSQALRYLSISARNTDPATDFSRLASHNKVEIFRGLQVSDLLEAASIRHCLVGDAVAQVLGSDTLIGDTFVAVCDDQLAVAGALLSATGIFFDAETNYYDDDTTDDRFPGFVFVAEEIDVKTNPRRIMVVPASYWHLDLSTKNYARNTVLVPEPRCRFPNKLHYMDGSSPCSSTRQNDTNNVQLSTHQCDC